MTDICLALALVFVMKFTVCLACYAVSQKIDSRQFFIIICKNTRNFDAKTFTGDHHW